MRLSPAEYKQVLKESEASSQSAPELLREAYFKQPPRKVLMSKNDIARVRKDLNRIGNNLNQIAKRLNSGLMHGWSDSLDLILEEFKTLTSEIYYGYGVCKG